MVVYTYIHDCKCCSKINTVSINPNKVGLFEVSFFLLNNLFKACSKSKNADIICYKVTLLVSL